MKERSILALAAAWALTGAAVAQDFSGVEIETAPVADGLFMLVGQGGNIGLSTGEDGSFIVDTQFAPLTEKIRAAVREAGGGEIEFVVNTHWHGDHTGGNANFGESGATIVAHDNVKARLTSEQTSVLDGSVTPPAPDAAVPVLTFPARVNFHWNDNAIEVFHVESAHTDGDSIVHFPDLNAFHMGDVFFNGTYPFIDVGSGGSLDGIIAAARNVLDRTNDETRIIPGHGPMASREDLANYVEVLTTIRGRIQSLIDQSRSEDEVVTANPTEEWDETWGAGFMNAETFTRLAYRSLSR